MQRSRVDITFQRIIKQLKIESEVIRRIISICFQQKMTINLQIINIIECDKNKIHQFTNGLVMKYEIK